MLEKHLLIKHSILKQFSIRKSISAKALKSVCKKIALNCSSEQEFNEKVRHVVSSIDPLSVPGTIPLSDFEKRNNFLNVVTHNIINYLTTQKTNEDEIGMILDAIEYSIKNKEVPFFDFFDEDGKPNSSGNRSDDDESEEDKKDF